MPATVSPPKRIKESVRTVRPAVSEYDLVRSICRESYYEFLREAWPHVCAEAPHWNWHIRELCGVFQELMERVFRGERKLGDLVVNIAPGSTKSLTFSVVSMPWVWTRMPTAKGIFGSFALDLSLDLSLKARDLVQSDWYKKFFPEVRLRPDQSAKGLFMTTAGGYRFSTAVGGNVTGRHGHLIVVDDPVDPEQAASEADLFASNRWLMNTLPSRKVDKAVTPTILVMQRLNEGDATHVVLKRPGARHVCLPAELTDKVKPAAWRKYYRHGLMDPVRLSKDVLRSALKDMGEYDFSAQYLQDPTPPSGGLFKVGFLKRVPKAPPCKRACRFWDKASTLGGGDYTAGVKLGVDKDGVFWVLDVRRGRYDAANRENHIRRTARLDGRDCLVGVEQEGGGGGKESADATVRGLAGYKVKVLKVGKALGDKADRAYPLASQVNCGNVGIIEAAWTEDFISELKSFPRGRYDDQVDAVAGAFVLLTGRRRRAGALVGLTVGAETEIQDDGIKLPRRNLWTPDR